MRKANGAVAQSGERLTGSQKVEGSNPSSSTFFSQITPKCFLEPKKKESKVATKVDCLANQIGRKKRHDLGVTSGRSAAR